jgi:hypothetical protein
LFDGGMQNWKQSADHIAVHSVKIATALAESSVTENM